MGLMGAAGSWREFPPRVPNRVSGKLDLTSHLPTQKRLSAQTHGFGFKNLFNFFCVSHGGVNHPCGPEPFLKSITNERIFSVGSSFKKIHVLI